MTTAMTSNSLELGSEFMNNDNAAIDLAGVKSWCEEFQNNPQYRLAQNAVTQNDLGDVALDRSVVTGIDHTFSHKLDDWKVTNQKKSGRCWMFAALNLFRVGAMKKMNIKEFEFSQNYPLFWDKFERANYFLEAIIETADRPIDDRTVCFLLDHPVDDGGQWNMFINLLNKHGAVPQSVMPETKSSSHTLFMNRTLVHKLHEGARSLRELHSAGASIEKLRAEKNEILKVIYRMLCIHLGTPPRRFDWQWRDEDKEFHRDSEMTPLEFADKYITLPRDEYVCIVNDTRQSSPYGKTFTVNYLGNVVGGEIVKYLNVEIDVMKDIAMRTIMDGEPVWFGCDSGKMIRRDMGLWDAKLFDYNTLYDTQFNLEKEERLNYHQTCMTHAMLFTGIDVVNNKPRKWRVENSWGDDNTGAKGFFVISDSWFDEHMFEIAARKSYLPKSLQAALDETPIVLPPWDPMGALAKTQ